MKLCPQCKTEKDFLEFPKDRTSKDGYRRKCKMCCNTDNKSWRKSNPNYSNQYYSTHTNARLIIGKNYRVKHKEKIKIKRIDKYKNNLELSLLRSSKNRAKKHNLEHTITMDDIKIPSVCPVLNIPLFYSQTGGLPNDNSPSIDRIDNSKGYTKNNIIIVSRRANVLKNDATIEELEKIVNFYKQL